jgi:NAD-dependent SIR2 family protein deacetylase
MFTRPYSDRVKAAGRLLAQADFTLIGAGAGLSAAAGLNYQDPDIFRKWYPQFARLGLNTIWEAIVAHWAPNYANRRRFWAFWSHHIQTIRYDAPPGTPYLHLSRLVAAKPHFVITTNVDAQFAKAGFLSGGLFTPQGDYGKFQCAVPCSDTLYDNGDLVQNLITNMDDTSVLVRDSDIPRCPKCGDYLERNLRRDQHFVETPYMERQSAYQEFLNRSTGGILLLLELGVGFNTPGIIRWPFERLASHHPHASLLRVNVDDARVPSEIETRSIGFREDAAQVIRDLLGEKAMADPATVHPVVSLRAGSGCSNAAAVSQRTRV